MYDHKQQHSNFVSFEVYDSARPWRAAAEELAERPCFNESEEISARGRFTMRLLESSNLGAHDQLVEVVATDGFASGSPDSPLVVTVRSILQDDEKGRLKTCYVADDGIILNGNVDETGVESGYFIGGEGTGLEKLEADMEMVLLKPRKKTVLKTIALPIE